MFFQWSKIYNAGLWINHTLCYMYISVTVPIHLGKACTTNKTYCTPVAAVTGLIIICLKYPGIFMHMNRLQIIHRSIYPMTSVYWCKSITFAYYVCFHHLSSDLAQHCNGLAIACVMFFSHVNNRINLQCGKD